MNNPLRIATGGYLKRGLRSVLTIAVAGYLSFGPPSNINNSGVAFGSSGQSDIYNKKKGSVKVVLTVDGLKYVQDKHPKTGIYVQVTNVFTTDTGPLSINAYV